MRDYSNITWQENGKLKLLIIVGTRPEIIRLAAVINKTRQYFDVILGLRKKGIQFAAASGRQWASIEAVFEPVKEKVFYLSDNGAYVGCHGRNLFLNPIDRETAMELIRGIRQVPGLEVMVGGPDVVYVDTKDQAFIDWMVNGYKFRVKQVEDVTAVGDDIIKVSAYKPRDIQEAVKGLLGQFGDRIKDDHLRGYVDGRHGLGRVQRAGDPGPSGKSGHPAGGDHGFRRSAE